VSLVCACITLRILGEGSVSALPRFASARSRVDDHAEAGVIAASGGQLGLVFDPFPGCLRFARVTEQIRLVMRIQRRAVLRTFSFVFRVLAVKVGRVAASFLGMGVRLLRRSSWFFYAQLAYVQLCCRVGPCVEHSFIGSFRGILGRLLRLEQPESPVFLRTAQQII
jgi:hypothetical protein